MKRTKHGFTLVELIIVIAVIGVLAAILIPTFSNVIDKANAKSALSDARNTVTQYVTEAFENSSLPENIVVIVKKAGNYYLYGYNTRGDGSIQKARGGEAYKGLDSVNALFEAYSFNKKHPETPYPDSGKTDYDEATDGAFFLVPYTGTTPDVPIKGFHATKAAEELLPDETKYPTLNDKLTETVGEDVYIYHGVLLGGTYTLDNGNGGNGGGTPITPPEDKYATITYVSELSGDTVTGMPEPATMEAKVGTNHYLKALPSAENHICKGWKLQGTGDDAVISEVYIEITTEDPITLVAVWEELPGITVTLSKGDADSIALSAEAAADENIKSKNESNGNITLTVPKKYALTNIVTATATKSGKTHIGWTDETNHTYLLAETVMDLAEADMTLTPVWQTKFTVTFDVNGGTGVDLPDGNKKIFTIGEDLQIGNASATKSGKEFLGWRIEGGSRYAKGATIPAAQLPEKNFTLTAEYGFVVTYDANLAGVTAPPKKNVEEGETFSVDSTALVDPKGAHEFLGWSTSASATTAKWAPGAETDITTSTTIYGVWKEIVYDITVKLQDTWNGDTVSAGTITGAKSLEVNISSDKAKAFIASVDYFVPDAAKYTATASGSTATVTITGTRLAKLSDGDYVDYKAAGETGKYTASDTTCYQVISAKAGMSKVRTDATYLGYRYMLNRDIDVGAFGTIGRVGSATNSQYFTGTFDGNGKTLSNYSISQSNWGNLGLFSKLSSAGVIKNLTVTGTSVSGGSFVGGLVGTNEGTIEQCKVNLSVVGSNSDGNVGGLVGYNKGNIIGCVHEGKVDITYYPTSGTKQLFDAFCGGFVGKNDGTIEDCQHTSGDVTTKRTNGANGAKKVGGFVGYNAGTIKWSSTQLNNVTAVTQLGGFAGRNSGLVQYSSAIVLTKVNGHQYNTSYYGSYAGGLCGYNDGGTFSNCYVRAAAVYIGDYCSAMLFTTENGKIENCYSHVPELNCYSAYGASYSWGILYNSAPSFSNLYIFAQSDSDATTYTDNDDLKTKVAANTAWQAANCWDTTGSYVKLKKNTADTEYSIKFNVGNASAADVTATAPATQKGKLNTTITLPTLSSANTSSAEFAGWATTADATTATYAGGASYTIKGNATLYALWKVKVSYVANAPSGASASNGSDWAIIGGTVTLPNYTSGGASGGYMHVGFASASCGSTDIEKIVAGVGENYTVTRTATLYGVWYEASSKCIIYLPGEASGSANLSNMPSNQTVSGSSAQVRANVPRYIPSNASMTNATAWSFDSWTNLTDGGDIVYPEDTVTVNSVVILKANWTKNCYAIRSTSDYLLLAKDYTTFKYDDQFVIANDLSFSSSDYNGSGTFDSEVGQIGRQGWDYKFDGLINGNGYTISNYNYTEGYFGYVGMIAESGENCRIQYLNINNSTMRYNSVSASYCAVLVVRTYGGSFINIKITNSTASGATINGIMCATNGGGYFHNCYANGSAYNG